MDDSAVNLAAKRIGKLVTLSRKAAWDPEDIGEERPTLDRAQAEALAKVLSLIY
ncbi:MAG: hypothetical protein FJZ00_10660 [Candidatus Sericytochromatia bacterium]|uniref:Uncharacterized protein n=1 Tax=Candidatus Tanganyikabacteria bacterium TaxID=2961651 RepID=A0A937X3X8_9BACT|nr:hypothetical protein [Candidatus Tanganyikabacteria bacterium]